MSYTRQQWRDGMEGGTPLSAARLNAIEAGVESAASVADAAVPAVALDSSVAALVGGTGETGTALDGRYASKAPSEASRYTTMAQLLAAPPPQDMPTVAVVPYAAPSGETLHTLARIGGLSTNNVDLAGDTKFRYDGTPSLVPVAADNSYAQAPLLTGGVSQGAYYTAAYETITSVANKYLKYQIRTSSTTVSVRVTVNGRPTSETQYTFTGLTAGAGMFLLLTFPTPASRMVRVAVQGATGMKGVVIPTAETLTRPAVAIRRRVAVLGDSYEGGSGTWPDGAFRMETAGWRAAMMLGADSIWSFAIGGTGYVAAPDTNAFDTRTADIVACDPDIVIVSGSINDGSSDTAELRSAVDTVLSHLSTVPDVFVTGPSYPSGYDGNNAAVQARTLAAGRVFIDALAEPWLDVATMIRSDGVHPNAQGQLRRASRLYEGIAAALAP